MKSLTVFLACLIGCLSFEAACSGQTPTAEKTYSDAVKKARAEYRVSIAKHLRKASEVELLLLKFDGMKSRDREEETESTFDIEPYNARTTILDRKKIPDKEAAKLLGLIADQLEKPEHLGGAMCHFPVHGIRIEKIPSVEGSATSQRLISFSFCWECQNFWFEYPDGVEWLDTTPELQKLITELVPIPAAEIERFKGKKK